MFAHHRNRHRDVRQEPFIISKNLNKKRFFLFIFLNTEMTVLALVESVGDDSTPAGSPASVLTNGAEQADSSEIIAAKVKQFTGLFQ